MMLTPLNDGEKISLFDFQELQLKGLLEEKDIIYLADEKSVKINCVGLSINKNEEILIIFPKHYMNKNAQNIDSFMPIFRAIQLASTKASTTNWGKKPTKDQTPAISCNFPFASFYSIANYFKKYGLYFDLVKVTTRDSGKINWKKTISNTNFYLSNNQIFFHPLTYESSVRSSQFVTDAMIFAINHTIDLFGSLVNTDRVAHTTTLQANTQIYSLVVQKIKQIRAKTFNDRSLTLIDALIDFYSNLNHGKGYFFKSRNFAFVWQSAVMNFLQQDSIQISPHRIPILTSQFSNTAKFNKLTIYKFNEASQKQYIDIDHYWYDPQTRKQYIFDAKYYTDILGLDYKQIFYTLIQTLNPEMKNVQTISALILPSDRDHSKDHFSLDATFRDQMVIQNPSLRILEIYLDCRKVIDSFR